MLNSTCSIDDCNKPHFCRGWCTAHYSRWQRHGDPLYTKRQPPLPVDATEKWCPRCETTKPVDAYGRRRNGALMGYCRPCMASYDVAYRQDENGAENKRRASQKWSEGPRKEYDLQRTYGIGVADYEALLERQGGCCAICGADTPRQTLGERHWNVDHCHSTDRVRGLLCNSCNLGIGKFGDDPDLLDAAAMYLRTH